MYFNLCVYNKISFQILIMKLKNTSTLKNVNTMYALPFIMIGLFPYGFFPSLFSQIIESNLSKVFFVLFTKFSNLSYVFMKSCIISSAMLLVAFLFPVWNFWFARFPSNRRKLSSLRQNWPFSSVMCVISLEFREIIQDFWQLCC